MQTLRNTPAIARGLLLLLALVAVGCGPTEPPSETPPAQPIDPANLENVEFIALSAKWCTVCRRVPPLFAEMRPDYPNVTFLYLDIDTDDRAMKLAVEHNATALPYFLVLVDGKLVAKLRGLLPKADMDEFLRNALAKAAKAQN